MNALGFAARSLVRQPARATLGILGVAAVGALLFDMLLLSQGLIVSMRDLLDRSGYDVRVGVAERPGGGPLMPQATDLANRIAAMPPVRSVITVRFADGELQHDGRRIAATSIQAVRGNGAWPWTVMRGADIPPAPQGAAPVHALILNESAARTLRAEPGATIVVRASCSDTSASLPPVTFRLTGIAEFPFDNADAPQAATTAESLAFACAETDASAANLILVSSNGDPEAAAAAISTLGPDLQAHSNDAAVGRMEQTSFTYFRQISTVLTTVTLAFALLLITVLLTVSVNQRLGAIAALRALGFSRRRVVADVLSESALIVGVGGALSLPLGAALAAWLDAILKRMPGIPADLHFFVFEWRAIALHLLLLAVTAVLAAAYPMRVVARLPIAMTLRNEVIG